jgi:hypothetical protein
VINQNGHQCIMRLPYPISGFLCEKIVWHVLWTEQIVPAMADAQRIIPKHLNVGSRDINTRCRVRWEGPLEAVPCGSSICMHLPVEESHRETVPLCTTMFLQE